MAIRSVRRTALLAAGMAVWCLITSCGKKKEVPKAPPPVPVEVTVAETRSVPVQVAAIGTVEASSSVAVKARVDGAIVRVHFVEGQDVKKGEVLFSLDTAPFQAALRHAEAVLARDLAQVRNAEEQARRYASLLKDGIVTREQYDSYRTTADALTATVAADRAAVENARIELGYCTIRSPLTGRTGDLSTHAGNVVKSNDTTLVTIHQVNPVYVSFTLPEKDLSEIKRRMAGGRLTVTATLPSDPAVNEQGVVTFLDNMVDPATGMFRVKGTFANKGRKLWPGQFVNVVLTLSVLENAVVVPQQAILTGQKGQYVFIAKGDGTVEQRTVATGIGFGSLTVVQQGVTPGENIVTDGQMRLTPGSKIDIRTAGHGSPAGSSRPVPSGAAAQ